MDETEWLAERFEQHRPRLRAVAYRMLGSLAEADDAVQDAWLRLSQSDAEEIDNLGGWLTTVVARVCLNMLRSRRVRREDAFGVHLPDPVITPTESASSASCSGSRSPAGVMTGSGAPRPPRGSSPAGRG